MKKLALILVFAILVQMLPIAALGEGESVFPTGKNEVYNLNFEWKFKKAAVAWPLADATVSMAKDGLNFYDVGYDDSDWESVCVPHAPNARDSFDDLIADAGEGGLYRGFMFYRKHFTLDAVSEKTFIEFEAVRQSVYLYVNGKFVGYYEAGTAPIGFDISSFVKEGDNLVAIATDNAAYRGAQFNTQETVPGHTPGDLSGWGYQWNQKDFNEVQGGITGNVNLYVTGSVYQTLPLYNNLKTTGNYIYAENFEFEKGEATVTVVGEIRNESGSDKDVELKVEIFDGETMVSAFSASGAVKAASDAGAVFQTVVPDDAYAENPAPTNADTVDVTHITASGRAAGLTFWSPDTPYLYDVYTSLYIGGECVETRKITTGFRSVEYDRSNGGLLINGVSTYLKGYSQRSTNEWAVIGVANDWLSDYDMRLVRESGADFIRWMHVSPKPVAIRAGDKEGVVSVCPAGDKEGDAGGRNWDQRVEAMRDAIIYFRNSPSVIFYEAGNAAISADHMQEMTDMRKLIDPSGGRFMGCRSITNADQLEAAEWVGTMIYRYDEWANGTMASINKFMPIIETEYKRDESPRRVWDDFSPPDYDYVNKWLGNGAKKKDGFDVWDLNQEQFAVTTASSYDGYSYFYDNRVGGATGKDYYSGAAMMVWSDSNMHGRNAGTENCRTTGRVDPVRIKKQSFYALRAMQSEGADIHIVGHWNYPENTSENYNYYEKEWNGTYWELTDKVARRDPTNKTVYVVASEAVAKVELYINGALKSVCREPKDNFIYEFPHIDVTESGEISAVAYSYEGKVIARDSIETVGDAAAIRLTATTGPDGLIADGSDVCFIDVEIVDEKGKVCPLAYDKISFRFDGDGEFLGGYNSGLFGADSVIGKDYCFAECGSNRVFVRSALGGRNFTLTASVEGLPDAVISLDMTAFEVKNGLAEAPQKAYAKNDFAIGGKNTLLKNLVKDNIVKKPRTAVAAREKDVYEVTVNGYPVPFKSQPYRPDTSSGVLCAVQPVLDELGVGYLYTAGDKATLEIPKYDVTLVSGETTIRIGGDTNLTNAEFYTEGNEFIAEISAVLEYIPGVSVITDEENKRVVITK